MTDAFLYAAARTPFGRFGGALAEVRPDDLAAAALSAVLAKAPGLDPDRIGDVVWGNANRAGEDNRNVGRMAVLLAGLPVSVPAMTVNRLCGSSLDAAMIASRTVESGDADLVVAGGVESMTRAPWVLPKPSRAFPAGNVTAVSTTLGWRLVNDRMPKEWTVSLGEANEQLADELGICRARQDEFAVRSHKLAAAAWDDGFYDDLVVGVDGVDLARDEGIRAGSTAEKLAGLTPAFRPDGTITPGNASPLNDGASALLIGSGDVRPRPRPDRPDRRAGGARARAAALRLRPGRGRRQGAGEGGHRLGRRGRGGAQRGVRRPVAGLRRRLGSTPRSSTRRAARSPSATRWARPGDGSWARSPTGCASPATAGAWRRSASAWARHSRSCWRTCPDARQSGRGCRPPTRLVAAAQGAHRSARDREAMNDEPTPSGSRWEPIEPTQPISSTEAGAAAKPAVPDPAPAYEPATTDRRTARPRAPRRRRARAGGRGRNRWLRHRRDHVRWRRTDRGRGHRR